MIDPRTDTIKNSRRMRQLYDRQQKIEYLQHSFIHLLVRTVHVRPTVRYGNFGSNNMMMGVGCRIS